MGWRFISEKWRLISGSHDKIPDLNILTHITLWGIKVCRGRSSSVPSRIQMKHTNVLAPEKLILSKSVLNPQFQINNLLCPPPRQSLHHNLKTIGPRNHLTRRKSRSGVTLPTSRSWIQIKLCWLCLVYSEGSSWPFSNNIFSFHYLCTEVFHWLRLAHLFNVLKSIDNYCAVVKHGQIAIESGKCVYLMSCTVPYYQLPPLIAARVPVYSIGRSQIKLSHVADLKTCVRIFKSSILLFGNKVVKYFLVRLYSQSYRLEGAHRIKYGNI